MGYPATYDFDVSQNETVQHTFTWSVGDPLAPVNLTGYTAKFQVKLESNLPSIVSLTESSGIALGGVLGTIAITIPYATMQTLSPNVARYELELLTGSVMTPLMSGEFRIRDGFID